MVVIHNAAKLAARDIFSSDPYCVARQVFGTPGFKNHVETGSWLVNWWEV